MDEIYFSMAEASKTCPDLTETTGLAGEVPLKAQNMSLRVFLRVRPRRVALTGAPPPRGRIFTFTFFYGKFIG